MSFFNVSVAILLQYIILLSFLKIYAVAVTTVIFNIAWFQIVTSMFQVSIFFSYQLLWPRPTRRSTTCHTTLPSLPHTWESCDRRLLSISNIERNRETTVKQSAATELIQQISSNLWMPNFLDNFFFEVSLLMWWINGTGQCF